MTDREKLRYFLEHFQRYDEVTILSYTPCILLMEERNTQFKAEYARALSKRCRSKKGKTTIYAAESGLRSILKGSPSRIESNLKLWKELILLTNEYPDNLKIYVVKDEVLPCVSFVLAHVPENPWGKRAPWDLLTEYRVGIKRDQLFTAGADTTRESKFEYHIISRESDLPEGIRWICDELESKNAQDFASWFENSHIENEPPMPEIAILSAMEKEARDYRLCIDPNISRLLRGNQHGKICVKNCLHTLVFPPTKYGRYRTYETVCSVCEQFNGVKTFLFVGCAGGSPERVKIGDVVISSDIVDLIDEKILPKSARKSGPDTFDISSDLQIEFRAQSCGNVDSRLLNSAKGLCNITSQPRWSELVKKHLSRCQNSTEKERLLSEPPKIVVGPVWSSDHNINSSLLRDFLKDRYGVIAFGMEGGGLAAGAIKCKKNFIEIRGISDLADGQRNDNILQPLAMAMAAACAEALLDDILSIH